MNCMDHEPAKVGRPSVYDSEVCERAKELMKQGASLIEVAYHLHIARSTLHEWRNTYPEFSDAIKAGIDDSEGWWMTKGRENIENKEFNSTLWYMNMKNRFKWKDKQDSDNSVMESLLAKVIDKL